MGVHLGSGHGSRPTPATSAIWTAWPSDTQWTPTGLFDSRVGFVTPGISVTVMASPHRTTSLLTGEVSEAVPEEKSCRIYV
jgi:hypothetical protein